MEEKSKEVKMKKKDPEKETQDGKLTYEQLEQIAGNLQSQCQQLHNQLMTAQNVINNFNEIEMMLEILGKAEYFNENFVTRCSDKIEEIVNKALDNAEKAENQSGSN